jgi:hypothetical protein
MPENKLNQVLKRIDAYNAGDPHQREQEYSEHLTAWVLRLQPQASEALRIAARGQHVGRWTIPRERYPLDRGGYLRWREDLKKFHARTVGEMMQQAGYDSVLIERVQSIILKKNLSTNPEAQTIEDALCLVFLETQFEDLQSKTPEEKMIPIVQKTWKKMSPAARELALQMPMPEEQGQLIGRALKGSGSGPGRRADLDSGKP